MNLYRERALEATRLNAEKRGHYLMDHVTTYLEAQDNAEALSTLQTLRARGLNKKINLGPYQDEKFPFTHFSPEAALQARLSGKSIVLDKTHDSRFDDLIVALELADY